MKIKDLSIEQREHLLTQVCSGITDLVKMYDARGVGLDESLLSIYLVAAALYGVHKENLRNEALDSGRKSGDKTV